ncbi:hypothetical protein DPQ22_00375 [Candidatus Tokpelaia sp.]|nr:hypothetical protein DPQ22_00375 [Candidatus Tokpelaia sp.]
MKTCARLPPLTADSAEFFSKSAMASLAPRRKSCCAYMKSIHPETPAAAAYLAGTVLSGNYPAR